MRRFFKPTFQSTFDNLPRDKQLLVIKAMEALKSHLQGGSASHGLRVKKLYQGKTSKVFEARVSADLRIVWVSDEDKTVFALIGNHEDVRRFLRNF